MIPSTLPPLERLPELLAESSASSSGSGTSQPATPADEESFAHQMGLFGTPRKTGTGSYAVPYDNNLENPVEAVITFTRGTGTNMLRDKPSMSPGGSLEESTSPRFSSSAQEHQILIRSPTTDADSSSPSLSPDMPSLARSQTLYRQPNITFGITPLLGTLPSSSSLAGNVSHAGLSESNTTSTLSLASAPDSMLAINFPRPEVETIEEAPATFPVNNIGTPDPQFADRSLTAEGYEEDSDRAREDDGSSLGPGDDYADTLVSSASELDCAGLTELIMRGAESDANVPDRSSLELAEPFTPLEQNDSLFPLTLMRDLTLTPLKLAILGAAQLLHPAFLSSLLFGSSHALWPRTPAPLGGIRRLEAYARALHGAGFTFLFVLLLLWQLGGLIGRAVTLAALTRAVWVWSAFELDIDRAMAQNEDVACAWALLFSKEKEVVGWMAQRARMEMNSNSGLRGASPIWLSGGHDSGTPGSARQ